MTATGQSRPDGPPADQEHGERDARHSAAEDAFLNDPDVQRLMQQGARLVPDSIRPLED